MANLLTDTTFVPVPVIQESVAPVSQWTITPSIVNGVITLAITMMTSRGPRVISVVAGDAALDAELAKIAPGLTPAAVSAALATSAPSITPSESAAASAAIAKLAPAITSNAALSAVLAAVAAWAKPQLPSLFAVVGK